MGTIADKLSYLLQTKNLIKAALIEKGASITDNTPFRDYAEAIGGISGGDAGITPIGTDGRPTGAVTVPKGITNLSYYIFKDNTGVNTIRLSEGLTSLADSCFYGCSVLIKVFYPSTLTSLPAYCHYKNIAMQVIDISDTNINAIGKQAFQENSALENIVLNTNLQNIGEQAFYQCPALKTLTIPQGSQLTSIGKAAFHKGNATNYTAFENQIMDFSNTMLQSVGEQAFAYNKFLKIVFPKTITEIGGGAFAYCESLSEVEFADDTPLKSITLVYGGVGGMFGNTAVSKAVHDEIAAHAVAVCHGCFYKCENIVGEITVHKIEGNSASIGTYEGCTGITKATVNVISGTYENSLFSGCTALEEISINAVENSACTFNAFAKNCAALKKVKLPALVGTSANRDFGYATTNANYAFYGCTALETVVVGENWNAWLNLSVSENLTVDCMVGILNNLADNTGGTTKTVTFGTVNLAKLNEEQIAIGTAKNWTVA